MSKSPRNRKKRLLAVLIPAVALLVAILTLSAILFVPFLVNDPVRDLFPRLFFDVTQSEQVTERWEKDGAEITLGSGENSIIFSLKLSDDTVAVGGLSESPILLPRKDAEPALAASPLHYDSGTSVALSREQYDSFLELLKALEADPEAPAAQEALTQTLERILDAVSEKLTPQVEYSFHSGRLALDKTVTYRIDLPLLSELLDVIAAEVKKNPDLNGMFGVAAALQEAGIELSESVVTVDALLDDLKRELTAMYASKEITLSYTLTAGELSSLTLSDRSSDKDQIFYLTSAELTPYIQKDCVGLRLRVSDTTELDGSSFTSETEYVYGKTVTEARVELSLTVESRSSSADSGTTQSYTSKETYSLSYDKSTHGFTIRHDLPELDSTSILSGEWELSAQTGLWRLSILHWEEDGENLLKTAAAAISVRPLESDPFSDGAALFGMSEEALLNLFHQLPAKQLNGLLKELTGESLEFVFSREDYLVPYAAQQTAESYANAFQRYAESNAEAERIPTDHLRVYSEADRVHILLTRLVNGTVKISYAYGLTDTQASVYHEAEYNRGNLVVHHSELIRTVEATCTQKGNRYYRCTDCTKEYTVEIPALDHAYEDKNMKATTDDGVERNVQYEFCSRCKAVFQVDLMDSDGLYNCFDLEKNADGSHTLGDYWISGYDSLFTVPDILADAFSINSIRLEEGRSYTLIRIPKGVRTIPKNTFTYLVTLQVLILPASLTEIPDGAFANAPSLHTIFYCGTEEQWASVRLNGYRDVWADVNVIFCPNGVSPEVAANSYFTEEKKNAALTAAKEQTATPAAAETFAAGENVTLVDSDVVTRVIKDDGNRSVAVFGVYTDGHQRVRVYECDSFTLLCEIVTDFEIVAADAWGGYLALSGNGGDVYIYRQWDGGGLEASFAPFSDSTVAVRGMMLMDGYLYYCNNYTVYARALTGESSVKLFTANSPAMVINRSLHRLVVFGTVNSPIHLYFVNTETAETLKSYQFSPDFPWKDEFPYLTEARHSPTNYYDPSGTLLKEAPTVQALEVNCGIRERVCSELMKTDRGNVTLCYGLDGSIYLLFQSSADSEPLCLSYYAESALLLSNGTLLLYTPNGYGLVAVRS